MADRYTQPNEANAPLFSAAKDLLFELKDILAQHRQEMREKDILRIEALIQKAEGA